MVVASVPRISHNQDGVQNVIELRDSYESAY